MKVNINDAFNAWQNPLRGQNYQLQIQERRQNYQETFSTDSTKTYAPITHNAFISGVHKNNSGNIYI